MPLSLIVLTDFFPAAHRALAYAAQLLAPLRARLVLLHVRPRPDTGQPAVTNLSPEAVALALGCLSDELAVPVVAEVGAGSLPEAAADAVRRHHPALLVLGRNANSPLPDEALADAAGALLRAAPCPLLVVPAAAGPAPLRRLLLAVDAEPFSLGEHAGTARQLLHALHADLTLWHCAPTAPAEVTMFADSVLRTGLTIDLPPVRTCFVTAGDPAAALLAALSSGAYDAVALVARPRSVWGRLFHRSVTAQVLRRSPVPVLVLPAVDS
ncbi:universal stress protein [Hymenobacter sp. CRA2]|uniref:universal stress protein n=1 Tax=Hymenobacter sp. CRA2 TaxID=1955620 RepID=UPI0009D08EF4|nr:universal stress protein [Hymenobacter sp. CRA2]OON69933.1 hypothetical protein B0919_04060 [Hymenobacter sp. CRA2]